MKQAIEALMRAMARADEEDEWIPDDLADAIGDVFQEYHRQWPEELAILREAQR